LARRRGRFGAAARALWRGGAGDWRGGAGDWRGGAGASARDAR